MAVLARVAIGASASVPHFEAGHRLAVDLALALGALAVALAVALLTSRQSDAT